MCVVIPPCHVVSDERTSTGEGDKGKRVRTTSDDTGRKSVSEKDNRTRKKPKDLSTCDREDSGSGEVGVVYDVCHIISLSIIKRLKRDLKDLYTNFGTMKD
jgi:hypothetical protein